MDIDHFCTFVIELLIVYDNEISFFSMLFVFSVWNICILKLLKNETTCDLCLLTCGTSKCGPCHSISELKNVASDLVWRDGNLQYCSIGKYVSSGLAITRGRRYVIEDRSIENMSKTSDLLFFFQWLDFDRGCLPAMGQEPRTNLQWTVLLRWSAIGLLSGNLGGFGEWSLPKKLPRCKISLSMNNQKDSNAQTWWWMFSTCTWIIEAKKLDYLSLITADNWLPINHLVGYLSTSDNEYSTNQLVALDYRVTNDQWTTSN